MRVTSVVRARSATTVTAVIAATVLPYVLAVASALPTDVSQWLLRLTPAAAFAIQQASWQYPRVASAYTPSAGYFPHPPWAGFAVLCGYTALIFGLAGYLLRRRDA